MQRQNPRDVRYRPMREEYFLKNLAKLQGAEPKVIGFYDWGLGQYLDFKEKLKGF